MIFESKRTDGLGWHDIYISKRNHDGSWNEPINLGAKINTADEDGTPQITPDGKYFFFTTVKSGDWGYTPYWIDAEVVTKFIYDSLVTDVDGNVYHTVTIGTQTWMVENLKTTKYRNGDPIPNVTENSAWSNLKTGAYCNYNNSSSNEVVFGKLYNWYTLNDNRNVAPTGWHVATDAEWTTLTNYLGGISVAGGKLKEGGSSNWGNPNVGATNEVGFTALPGGYRANNEEYIGLHHLGSWWCSTESGTKYAWARGIFCDDINVDRGDYYEKKMGFSVRCVKDTSPTGIEENKDVPAQFNLLQNYPNPFNPSTTIKYELKTQSFVKMIITNILGEIVFEAINEIKGPGFHEYKFNADNLSSGIYFYQLIAGKFRGVKKMVILQ